MGTIDVGGYEAVRSWKVSFAFSPGDLTSSCVSAQLFILLNIGLTMV